MSKLETNTIDTVSGTSNLVIGSTNSSTVTFENGAATGHNYPAFIAYNASTQSIPNATYTNYQYETEVLDTDNGFDTSTYTYTIPTAGKYFIAACAKKATGGSTDRFLIRLNKNGSENFYSENYSKDYNSVQFNTILDLSANDTLNVMVYQNTGGSVNMQAGTKYNVFYAYRIGA